MPIMTSLSTRFFGQPRLMNPTFGIDFSWSKENNSNTRDWGAPDRPCPRAIRKLTMCRAEVRRYGPEARGREYPATMCPHRMGAKRWYWQLTRMPKKSKKRGGGQKPALSDILALSAHPVSCPGPAGAAPEELILP